MTKGRINTLTCEACIHSDVCYRRDAVNSSHANKCGDYMLDIIDEYRKRFKCEDCEKIRADIKEAVAELKSENTNKVLEDIKAEIELLKADGLASMDMDAVLFMIDRHISGKENI